MKIPPQNIEAEQALIGSILLDPSIYDEARLHVTAEDFYTGKHGMIYKAQGAGGDLIVTCDALKKAGELDLVGGPAYLSELTDCIPSKHEAVRYAKIIREASKRREFIATASDMIADCYQGGDFGYMASEFEKTAFNLAGSLGGVEEAESIGGIIENSVDRLIAITEGGVTPGLMTGLIDFDKMTSGLRPDDLIIIAARPSMGKTALLFNILKNVAEGGTPVGVFSLEMGKEALGDRMLSSATQINSKAIRSGWINDNHWPTITAAAGYYKTLPLHIDDAPSLHISEMRSRARRMKSKHNIGLIAVDYLQLARGDGGNREQEVSHISRDLKAMAKELHIPVIALAQLNRGLESRPNKRPMLSDLRESGAIEQDADVIAFIYRDDYYNKDANNPLKGVAEIIFGKQRNGPTGTVKLGWQEETGVFTNLAR